jgi:hypothetical protein
MGFCCERDEFCANRREFDCIYVDIAMPERLVLFSHENNVQASNAPGPNLFYIKKPVFFARISCVFDLDRFGPNSDSAVIPSRETC